MIHREIFAEIPRIIRELELPAAHRQDPRFLREIAMQDGAMDMVYRLCCAEALTALSLELGKPQAEIYAAIVKVFKMSLDDLEKLMPIEDEETT